MKAVHFGAGNIGRGFIGAILQQSGYEVTFVDVNAELIDRLNQDRSYQVVLADETKESFTVDGVSGINSQENPDKAVSAIAEADIVTASVGPHVLPFIAPVIAKGLMKRAEGSAVNVIACENMIGGSDQLKAEVAKHLTEDVAKKVFEFSGFPNSAVDRIVPIQQHENPLTIEVERYFEWVIETAGLKGEQPSLKGALFVEDLVPFIERKLLTVNTGHASIAYNGLLKGYQTVKEAMDDSEVVALLEGVLTETSLFLTDKFDLDQKDHQTYVQKIIERYRNPYISDGLDRVGRAPLRKLSAGDRLTYPAVELDQKGNEPAALEKTIAAALKFDVPEDPEAVQLQAWIVQDGPEAALEKASGIKAGSSMSERIITYYHQSN
ncbi:mannitol-1-phosphate 5-dehydrogenase [Jeotgalibacillus alimentarius]|uniref:Mannitol-1-phosphate 5-dehydrogenase n=1 Tax=Jeotgalibacillus alimentarius TaxID=135826 RepID=A0A0C2W5P2_9BACL|nr:mannitol-1-phosphate 5-dehydrogenase [Jeotgalibacillus alimentarius]KIL51358.1 mannitol-1-phosphate 5-dehydrogenase [Jeotgalibacillus alimentarius]